MMKKECFAPILLLGFILIVGSQSVPTNAEVASSSKTPLTNRKCSSFCLDNGDYCVFGANQDNNIDAGLLFVNKRHVLKMGWDPSTTGEYARWISKYGSVTVVHAGYQMAWAGMNEAGLMISTMSLGATQNPPADERPPLSSSFWAQYLLDNFATVEEVIASDSMVRIFDTVDHYLVCDRTGDCATIEYLEGKMVAHTGDTLPVKALTNSVYWETYRDWEEGRHLFGGIAVSRVKPDSPAAVAGLQAGDLILAVDEVSLNRDDPFSKLMAHISTVEIGDEVDLLIHHRGATETATVTLKVSSYITESGEEVPVLGALALSSINTLDRFVTLADRLDAYAPTSSEEAIAHAFDTLAEVALNSNAWRIVFDPANLRMYFRTNQNPQVRYVDFDDLSFSCQTPVMMLDIHADFSGDVSDDLETYSHDVNYDHMISFVDQYERLDLHPLLIKALLYGAEGFACKEGDEVALSNPDQYLQENDLLLPPRVTWIGLTVIRLAWPVWVPLVILSLVYVVWQVRSNQMMTKGRRIGWVLVVAIFGPIGLLFYLLVYSKRNRAMLVDISKRDEI